MLNPQPNQSAASQSQPTSSAPRTSGRGFASMDPAMQRAIASKGGKAAHAKGRAHEFTSEEARIAGRKGGQAAHRSGRAHEFTSEEARIAGRKGGQRSLKIAAAAAATANQQPAPASLLTTRAQSLLTQTV